MGQNITSIKCWNGGKLQVAFLTGCFDRSIIAWNTGKYMKKAVDLELMIQEALSSLFGKKSAFRWANSVFTGQ